MGVVVRLKPGVSDSSVGREEASDADLVRAARSGRTWAQETLYRRHVRMVTGLAHRVLPGDSDIDDLVQDAFVAAFEGLDRLANPQAFASFLGSITVRHARRRIRRRRMLRRLGLARSEPGDLEEAVSSTAPPDVGAELRALYALVSELPTDERLALVLRRVEGLTVPQIAEWLGCSLATAKRRIAAAEIELEARLSRPLPRSTS